MREQTMKWKIPLLFILFVVFAIGNVNATVYVPTSAYFYVNGEWVHFSEAHTFTTVQRVGGIWYFDGKTFDQIEPTPYIPPIPPIISGYQNTTLYFRSSSHTVNNVTAYELEESKSNSLVTLTDTNASSANVSYGFRLWRVRSNSALQEITSGVTNLFTFNTTISGRQSGYWTPATTSISLGFDALEITIYQRFGSAAWTAKASYITDGIMSNKILYQTWTFNLYVSVTIGTPTTSSFSFGDSSHASCITGIGFRVPFAQEIQAYFLAIGDFIQFLFYGYTSLLGEGLFLGLMLLGLCSTTYIKFKNFGAVLMVFILFGGTGGLVWAFVPPPALFLVWVFLLVGFAVILFRVIR